MYDIILSFITAFGMTFFAIPSIINVAKKKNLVDIPGERHIHKEVTPSLGGIGIFAGVIFSVVMWTPFDAFTDLQYILAAFVIIFLMGAKDDIDPMPAIKKLGGQFLAACILVFKANIRLESMYGVLGIHSIPEWFSIVLSVFTIVLIINAFNLIDGVNGLAGSITILISVTFGAWFFMVDRVDMAIIAFALIGGTLAFLSFNYTPAEIFMGDTGSLFLGLICSILAIEFISFNNNPEFLKEYPSMVIRSAPAVAVGILAIPLFDTLRVFTTRMLKGRSPFSPDKTHIHHLLLDLGMSHTQVTISLIFVNLGFIGFSYYYQNLGSFRLMMLLLLIAIISTAILYLMVRRIQALKTSRT